MFQKGSLVTETWPSSFSQRKEGWRDGAVGVWREKRIAHYFLQCKNVGSITGQTNKTKADVFKMASLLQEYCKYGVMRAS